jgi:hypothetical protein
LILVELSTISHVKDIEVNCFNDIAKFAIKNLSKLAKGNWVISAISWQEVTFDEIMMISLAMSMTRIESTKITT